MVTPRASKMNFVTNMAGDSRTGNLLSSEEMCEEKRQVGLFVVRKRTCAYIFDLGTIFSLSHSAAERFRYYMLTARKISTLDSMNSNNCGVKSYLQ